MSLTISDPASPELAAAKEAPGDADPDAVATGSYRVLLGFPGTDASYGDPVPPEYSIDRLTCRY